MDISDYLFGEIGKQMSIKREKEIYGNCINNKQFPESFTIDNVDLPFKIEIDVIDFIPGCPPPYCSNPSHQDYADSGEDDQYEYIIYFVIYDKNNKKIRIKSPKELGMYFEDVIYNLILNNQKKI